VGLRVTLLAGGTGGDDAEIHGLHVSPDVDALLYTLSGLVDSERGWGIRSDTLSAHEMFERLGEPTWFTVGDADLATHVHRTRLLREGATLTDATAAMAGALGIGARILPATDDWLRTRLETDAGVFDFQDYFVRLRQEPTVTGIRLEGIAEARPTDAVLAAIADAELIVIGPSNPFVSIGPILELTGVRQALAAAPAPKVAVSPIVAGQALKGPADRMMSSMGHEPSALGVARLYSGLVDRLVIDTADADLRPGIEDLGMSVEVLPTVMRTDDDRRALGATILPGR
jgi:LPPG:FO 2-phospho-L-lactate transferase